MVALQEMLAAHPGSQMPSIDSISPPGLLKSGFPESSQPVQLQTGTHGVVGVVVENGENAEGVIDGERGVVVGGMGVVVGRGLGVVVVGGLGVVVGEEVVI